MYLQSTQQILDRMDADNRTRGFTTAETLDQTRRELRILNEMLSDYLPQGHHSGRSVDQDEIYTEYATHVDEQMVKEEAERLAALGDPLKSHFELFRDGSTAVVAAPEVQVSDA